MSLNNYPIYDVNNPEHFRVVEASNTPENTQEAINWSQKLIGRASLALLSTAVTLEAWLIQSDRVDSIPRQISVGMFTVSGLAYGIGHLKSAIDSGKYSSFMTDLDNISLKNDDMSETPLAPVIPLFPVKDA